MKKLRFAAGIALFYCTVVGVCQSIPAQPRTGSQPEDTAPTAAVAPSATQGARTSIKFYVTGGMKNGLTPKSCQDILAVLLPDMQAYPHPSDWTWFVACDEPAWAEIQLHQGHSVSSGILAITNRPAHATIIRGSAILRPYSDDYRAQPEHIIAHELCHIYLESSDESRVDDLATQWVRDRRAKHLAVLTR